MLAKLWKKVLMFILIVACLFNVVFKLVNNLSLEKELLSSAQYIQDMQDAEKAKAEQEKNEKEKSSESTEQSNQQNDEKNTQENVIVIK